MKPLKNKNKKDKEKDSTNKRNSSSDINDKNEIPLNSEFVDMEIKIHRDKNFLKPDDKVKTKNKNIKEKQFFEDSAFVNVCNKKEICRNYLYITGGKISNTNYESNRFIQVDINNKMTCSFPNMNETRSDHGMVVDFNNKNTIYVVGGENKLTAEKYDFSKKKWSNLPSLKNVSKNTELKNPNLTIFHSYLYCFFGFNIHEFTNEIYRLNTKIPDSKWERINYLNPDRIDLGRIFSGIVKDRNHDRKIIFIGGMTSTNSATNIAFEYDFISSTFKSRNVSYEKNYLIKETNLVDFEDNSSLCFDNPEFNTVLILKD
jgi:hypothetical protein